MILLDKAMQYAKNVADNKEITTWEVKKQCKIFLNDYSNRQYKKDFDFYFDKNKLKKINNLLKLINFATGFVEGKQVLENLAPFQAFFIANIFGWRFKNKPYKFRYNNNTLFIARKNSKTATIAIIFILLMLTEQNYSEFYSICLTKELAAEIKKAMEQIINSSPLIRKHFNISKTKTGRIACNITNSFFEPRVAQAGKNNSIRPCAFVSDEHANFKENSNFNAMKSGQKNVLNGLVFRTTTAYAINNSIMEEDLRTIRKVLKGEFINERMFSLVYYAEEENLWNDTGLYQANPLRLEDNFIEMRNDRELALQQENLVEEFITKTCNRFVRENEEKKYIDLKEWEKYEVEKIDFTGMKVVVGLDFAISLDLNARVILGKKDNKYYAKAFAYLPDQNMNKRREKINYYKAEKNGFCEIHRNASVVNYNKIEKDLLNIEDKYKCKIICFATDPYNAIPTMKSVEENGFETFLCRQSYTNLSPTIKDFRDKVYNGQIIHEKNILLDWCIGNAIEQKSSITEDILLKKGNKNKDRIDLLMALIFAYDYFFKTNFEEDVNEYFSSDNFTM